MNSIKLPIIVVDDDNQVLDNVERNLKSMFENEVIGFTDPNEALAWAKENMAVLCMIDYRMPGLNGIDLVRKLRRLDGYDDNPMILLTSDISREIIPEVFDAGFTDYAIKPVERSELFARVNTALELYESKLLLSSEKDHLQNQVEEAQDVITEKEMRFRLAVEATEDGIWDLDLQDNNVFLSRNWFSIIGYNEDETPQSFDFWISRIHEKDTQMFLSTINAVKNEKTTVIDCTYRMMHKDGEVIWVATKGKLYCNDQGMPTRLVGAHRDVTDIKTAYRQLAHDALHDSLTGLPNRALLEERLQHTFLRYKRNPESPFTVMFIDVDNFKDINDTFGHASGDQLLVELANILRSSARDIDTICRFGGDEFVIIFERTSTDKDVKLIADRIYEVLGQPFLLADNNIKLEISMGAVIVDQNYDSISQILKDADVALYKAKGDGRNQLAFYDHTMQHLDPKRQILLDSLKSALDNREIIIYYQPIVDLVTFKTVGFEALLRWHHPKMGLISPVDFIPLAERNDMINKLSQFVLDGSIRQIAQWQKDFNNYGLFMCVNMVSSQIAQSGFLESIQKDCMLNDVRPESLVLEFSEYSLSQVFKWDSLFLSELKQVGFNIALDDYGESRASIRSLVDYKMNVLKVDRSLSLEILHDERKRRLFDLMIHLGHKTDLKIVVEGIQTQDILNYVKRSKAQYGQGFLFSKPIPAKEATKFLKDSINTASIKVV